MVLKMNLKSKSKKSGVILSYVVIVVQALINMLLTRLYLDTLGTEAYGLYQMIYAVAQYILILDLGIGTVIVRYVSEFNATDNKEKRENFAFHFGFVLAAISILVSIVGIIINKNIEHIYTNLSPEEYTLSHQIFRFMVAQIVLTIISHYFNGICEAYERFTFTKVLNCAQIVLNFALKFVLLKLGMGIWGIVLSNTIMIVIKLFIMIMYDFFVLKFKVKFHYVDKSLLTGPALLMVAMLLQAIVGNVNSSVDKTILGMFSTKTNVTIYGISATIVTMFNTLPSTVSTVFQPQVIKLTVKGADSNTLTQLVAKLGRLQFMLLGGFLGGFIVFGRDFIECWAGKNMMPAWFYVIIIMIPNSIPLIQNVCLAILNAYNKRLFRSLILFFMTFLNIILTVFLVKKIGPVGAPIGTAISYIVGHCIIINIYYQKKIGLKILPMFRNIFKRTWLCILCAMILTLPSILWKCNGNWFVLFAKGIVYCIIYGLILYKFGMNEYEISLTNGILNNIKKIVKK